MTEKSHYSEIERLAGELEARAEKERSSGLHCDLCRANGLDRAAQLLRDSVASLTRGEREDMDLSAMDPLDPPLCDNCSEVAAPGTECPACGMQQLDAAEIADIQAEAAISRAEDERMFGSEEW